MTEEVAFTYADFVLCDQRYAAHFAVVPRERWNDGMLPVAQWLRLPERAGHRAHSVPAGRSMRTTGCIA